MQDPDAPDTGQDPKERRRAIYLLPNLFTTAAMFAGFFAIIAAMGGRYQTAAIAIIVAGVLDGIDGRVARMTGTQSDFGKEYDSMSDLVSFGIAPALVMYQWSLEGLGGWFWLKLGWLAAFFYAVAAAMRLARFNSQAGSVDRRYFVGLSSPAAAGMLATFVWVGNDMGFEGGDLVALALLFTVSAGALMVSRIHYYSFKEFNLRKPVSFPVLVVIPLVFILIALNPPKVLFGMALAYFLSGPAIEGWRWWKRNRPPREP